MKYSLNNQLVSCKNTKCLVKILMKFKWMKKFNECLNYWFKKRVFKFLFQQWEIAQENNALTLWIFTSLFYNEKQIKLLLMGWKRIDVLYWILWHQRKTKLAMIEYFDKVISLVSHITYLMNTSYNIHFDDIAT